jgi:hypothetical protein
MRSLQVWQQKRLFSVNHDLSIEAMWDLWEDSRWSRRLSMDLKDALCFWRLSGQLLKGHINLFMGV